MNESSFDLLRSNGSFDACKLFKDSGYPSDICVEASELSCSDHASLLSFPVIPHQRKFLNVRLLVASFQQVPCRSDREARAARLTTLQSVPRPDLQHVNHKAKK